ncbi:hypothetical protein GTW43_24765 [Streptomyces sp. SID5785]|uniref:hypothetical protein n=1 Tax=Streptomyces sp. SID5785 TaxID=2690309 RepID=UPI00136191D4|nr:hypothetical protein [Streptomyces sp. SID5785]MZD08267.1 hypothetical protein [Streptomyces sp. SID5785]
MGRIVSAEEAAPSVPTDGDVGSGGGPGGGPGAGATGSAAGAAASVVSGTPIYDALLAEWKRERRHPPGGPVPTGLGRPRREAEPLAPAPAPPRWVPQGRAAS